MRYNKLSVVPASSAPVPPPVGGASGGRGRSTIGDTLKLPTGVTLGGI